MIDTLYKHQLLAPLAHTGTHSCIKFLQYATGVMPSQPASTMKYCTGDISENDHHCTITTEEITTLQRFIMFSSNM
jgi:hypothetical protein